MGKASSAKKIARAEKALSSSGPSERRQLGYPAAVALVIVLGLALVVFARATRDAEASPTLQDHWHAAYGVWDCVTESFLTPFQSEFDPEGIHSHQDGLIHIHPFTSSVTGKEAKLAVFLNAMGASLSEDGLELPGGATLESGVECNGEKAIMQVIRWENAFIGGEPTNVFTTSLEDVRFLNDEEAFTIARAPAGSEIPLPNTIGNLEGVLGGRSGPGIEPPNTTNVPGPQDFGVELD
jgi:hypothetical protein